MDWSEGSAPGLASDAFPEQAGGRAYTVGNGEVFWPLSSASGAAMSMAASGMGICGGEVYVGQGRTWGNIELEWMTEPEWGPGEAWTVYVERGVSQSLAAIENMRELQLDLELEPDREPMFFFACYSEHEHPRGLRSLSSV